MFGKIEHAYNIKNYYNVIFEGKKIHVISPNGYFLLKTRFQAMDMLALSENEFLENLENDLVFDLEASKDITIRMIALLPEQAYALVDEIANIKASTNLEFVRKCYRLIMIYLPKYLHEYRSLIYVKMDHCQTIKNIVSDLIEFGRQINISKKPITRMVCDHFCTNNRDAYDATYQALYDAGLLSRVALQMKQLDDVIFFAFDTEKLRTELMHHPEFAKKYAVTLCRILDADIEPCMFSGTVQMRPMSNNKNMFGILERPRQSDMIRSLRDDKALLISSIMNEYGQKDALNVLFKLF